MPNQTHLPDLITSTTCRLNEHRTLPYYHEHMDKDCAYRLLKNARPGFFLLRPSSILDCVTVLSLRTPLGVVHVRIYRNENGYYLDDATSKNEKTMDRDSSRYTYESVESLIERFTKRPGQSKSLETLKLIDNFLIENVSSNHDLENESEADSSLRDEVQLIRPILARKKGLIVQVEPRSSSSDNLWGNVIPINAQRSRPSMMSGRRMSEGGAKDWLSDVL